MKRKYNEFYIGLAVIITIAVVIATILFLEKNNFLQSGMALNLVVTDAQGINSGADVLYRGLKVGSVDEADITKKGILLRLKISLIDSIPVDSRFEIGSSNILGSKSVEITPGHSNTYLKNGAFVEGEPTTGFTDVIQEVDNVTENANQLIKNVNTLTKDQVRSALIGINKSIKLIQQSLQNNLKEIHTTIENIKEVTTHNKAPIDSIVYRLSENSKKITIVMENIEKITGNLNEITSGINNGKGTAGKLLTNDELYNKINNTVTSLDSLINDIKNHPERYFHISIF